MIARWLLGLLLAGRAWAATPEPVLKNDKVTAYDVTLAGGQVEAPPMAPNVLVFWADGTGMRPGPDGKLAPLVVKRGEVLYRAAHEGPLQATGRAGLHFERIDLPGPETKIEWGTGGLAPHYRLLFENGYARVYDIRIPAGTSEPQHSHHDRVVVCLSGAELRHEMPDGRVENSTLKTGDCLWRRGGTHVGHNLGSTNLWVIAIEPK